MTNQLVQRPTFYKAYVYNTVMERQILLQEDNVHKYYFILLRAQTVRALCSL